LQTATRVWGSAREMEVTGVPPKNASCRREYPSNSVRLKTFGRRVGKIAESHSREVLRHVSSTKGLYVGDIDKELSVETD
jgi:hypothetical protein